MNVSEIPNLQGTLILPHHNHGNKIQHGCGCGTCAQFIVNWNWTIDFGSALIPPTASPPAPASYPLPKLQEYPKI